MFRRYTAGGDGEAEQPPGDDGGAQPPGYGVEEAMDEQGGEGGEQRGELAWIRFWSGRVAPIKCPKVQKNHSFRINKPEMNLLHKVFLNR